MVARRSGSGGPATTRVGLVSVILAGIIWGTIGPAVRVVHDDSGLSPLLIVAAIAGLGRTENEPPPQ
jgi:drug/metabolite transporter (DMT)-like permease